MVLFTIFVMLLQIALHWINSTVIAYSSGVQKPKSKMPLFLGSESAENLLSFGDSFCVFTLWDAKPSSVKEVMLFTKVVVLSMDLTTFQHHNHGMRFQHSQVVVLEATF